MDVRDFAAALKAYGLAFSCSVTSWGRTVERNDLVGGAMRSAHVAWLAVDVVYDGAVPGPEADRFLAEHGLLRIIEHDHDHIQPRDWKV